MCHHSISLHVKRSREGINTGKLDRTVACEVYDAHAAAVHGAMMRVVQCEECASDVMVHTFVKVCSEGGAKPTLSRLLRTAFTAACGAADEIGNQEVRARIRMWYLEAQALRDLPSTVNDPPPLGSGTTTAFRY